jgi:hypothetical protein
MPVGAVKLVGGEDVEVAAQRLHIHPHSRHRLAAVEQEERTDGVGELRRPAGVENGAEDVRHMGERHQLVPLGQHRCHRLDFDPAVVRQRRHVDGRAGAVGDHLPGHDVGVMLEDREHDPVAGLEEGPAPALRDEVDSFGGAADGTRSPRERRRR